jgi:U3 small nucleolar RNA-associated protein 14
MYVLMSTGGAPADGEELPKKGLLALPFMARALERQRVAAQQEAQQVLQELEQEEEEGRGSGDDEGLAAGGDGGRGPGAPTGHRAGRLTFGAGAAAAAQGSEEEDEMSEDDELMGSDDEEDLEAKAERLGRKLAPSEGGEQKQRRQHQKQQQEERVPLPELTPEEQAEVDAMLGIERPQSTTAARSRGQQVTSNGAGSRLIHSHAAGAVAHTAPTQTRSHRKADRLAAANGHHHAPAAQGYATAGQASQQPSSSPRQQQQPPQQEPAQQSTFFPAPKFQGARPGYVFKRGPQGVGYYLDVVPSKAGKAGKGSQGRGKGKGSEGGGGAAAQAGGKQKVSAAPFQEGLTAAAASQQVPGSSGKQDTRRPLGGKESLANGHKGGVDAMDDSSDDDDEDRGRGREGMVADAGAGGKKGSGQPSQLDLIRQAFAGEGMHSMGCLLMGGRTPVMCAGVCCPQTALSKSASSFNVYDQCILH